MFEIVEGLGLGAALRLADRFVLLPVSQYVVRLSGLREVPGGGPAVYSRASFVAWIAFLTVFAGVVEESLYRGYAIQQLRQRFRPIWAVLISSLFFALPHFGEGLSGMLDAAMFGVLLGGFYLWRRSLLPLALAHAIANLLELLGHLCALRGRKYLTDRDWQFEGKLMYSFLRIFFAIPLLPGSLGYT